MKKGKISIYLKWGYASFMFVLIPAYWIQYGPANFLWFSDITLILAFFAVILEQRFLASMATVGGLALELFWNIDFLIALVFGYHVTGLTDYMFDPSISMWIRVLSLFHMILPPLLLWLIIRLGYDNRAWLVQTLFSWVIIAITWLLTEPSENINWVFNYQKSEWLANNPLLYLFLESAIVAATYAITHLLLTHIKMSRKS